MERSDSWPFRRCKFGYTPAGDHIIVLWDEVSDDPPAIYPVTAYRVKDRDIPE